MGESLNNFCACLLSSLRGLFPSIINLLNNTHFTQSHSLSVLNTPSPGDSTVAQGRGRRLPLTLALLAPALLFLSSPAFASGEPGGFTQWGAGARSLGMGRAFLAVSDDASASYWN